MRRTPRKTAKRLSKQGSVLRRQRGCIESLEPRLALYVGETLTANEAFTISPSSAISYSTQASGMPILHSNASAPADIFLDFTGGPNYQGANGYDTDGNPSTYSVAEQNVIVEVWRAVTSAYGMFNLDITTIKPANLNTTPTAWINIGNTGYSQSLQGAFPNTSIADSGANTGDAQARITALVHELGHNFGNDHDSNFDDFGKEVDNYYYSSDPLDGHLMGYDYSGMVNKWTVWHKSTGASGIEDVTVVQDSLATIASAIASKVGGTGFRADVIGNTIPTATPLAVTGTTQWASGVIETLSDVDMYSFTAAAGTTYSISVARDSESQVDTKIALYDSSGTLLGAVDGDPRTQSNVMVNNSYLTIPIASSGTYYLAVASHGNQDDLGPYIVRVDPQATGWQSQAIGLVGAGGYASYDAATSTYTVAGSGAGLPASTADAFYYDYQILRGDGSITAKVTGLGYGTTAATATAKAGVMIREMNDTDGTIDPGGKFVMTNLWPGGMQREYRTTTNAAEGYDLGSAVSTPYWIRLTRSGNSFTTEFSSNGTTWTALGSPVTVSMTGDVAIGLISTDEVDSGQYGIVGKATFTNVSLTGTINPAPTLNALAVPGSLTVTSTAYNSVGLSWTDVSGESGYAIERSSDGVHFAIVGTTATNVVTWTDNAANNPTSLPKDFQPYFYRVRATAGSGASTTYSNPSASVYTLTRGGPVSDLRVLYGGATSATLDWTEAPGETGYTIQRSTDGATGWTTIGTAAKNMTIYTDATRTAGQAYYYRVQTNDASGVAATSVVVSSINNAHFTSVGSNSMTFAWDAVMGATGYKIERSEDGQSYSTLRSSQSGLSYTDNTVSPLHEYYYRITVVSGTVLNAEMTIFSATPPTPALTSPWQSIDIGSVSGSGTAQLSGGTFTVFGSGSDIGGTSDGLQFVYVSTTSTTAYIQAQVTSQEVADNIAKAGVMIRQSTAANSPEVSMTLVSGGSAYMFSRATTGGSTSNIGASHLAWVRVERNGNTFTAKVSSDGISWTTVGSKTVVMSGTVLMGLVDSAASIRRMTKDVFTNVTTSVPTDPLTVASSTPAANSTISTSPTSYSIQFSAAINSSSLQASDLTVNGMPANNVSLSGDGLTATFTFNTNPITAPGTQTMAIAAGAVTAQSNSALQVAAFNSQFTLSATPLAVSSTNPSAGGVFTLPGPFTFDVNFNQAIDPASISTSTLNLSGISGATVTNALVLAGNTTARFTISGITAEGQLTVSIAAGSVISAAGLGTAAFSASYFTDIANPTVPLTLVSVSPAGSLIYSASTTGYIGSSTDNSTFTLALNAGESITVVVKPSGATLQPTIVLRDPANHFIDSATAVAQGFATAVFTAPVDTAGTYKIIVSGLSGSQGGFSLQVTLDSTVEAEGVLTSSSNNTLGTAEDLSSSAFLLGGSGAQRLAIVGTTEAATPDYYQFPATAGEVDSVALKALAAGNITVDLLDSNGIVLASGVSGATNLSQTISRYTLSADGYYYLRVAGDAGVGYSLIVTQNAAFDTEPNNSSAALQSLDGTQGALGALQTGDDDWYSLTISSVPQQLTLTTSTPSDGSGQFANVLASQLELYNSSGMLLASGNLLGDGRNRSLQYEATTAGVYRVHLAASGGTQGEYFLSAALSPIAPLTTIDAVTIDNGTAQRSMVRSLAVTFSGAISSAPSAAFGLSRSSDNLSIPLTVSAVTPAAGGGSAVTLTFSGPALENGSLPDGQYILSIDGSQIIDTAGQPVDAGGTGMPGSNGTRSFFRLFGDVTGDGTVNGVDISTISSNWLTAGPNGDVNGDGIVNGLDIAAISSVWLAQTGGGTGASAVANAAGTAQTAANSSNKGATALGVSAVGTPPTATSLKGKWTSPMDVASFVGPLEPVSLVAARLGTAISMPTYKDTPSPSAHPIQDQVWHRAEPDDFWNSSVASSGTKPLKRTFI